jgi:hypothetical protein
MRRLRISIPAADRRALCPVPRPAAEGALMSLRKEWIEFVIWWISGLCLIVLMGFIAYFTLKRDWSMATHLTVAAMLIRIERIEGYLRGTPRS